MRSLAGGAALAMLAACTVGPNYRPPEAMVPGAFAGPQPAPPPGAAIDPARWWSSFGDAKLDAMIARAMVGNPDIQLAASRVRQARLQEIIANGQLWPTVDATANATRVDFSKNAGISSLASAFGGGGATGGGATGGSSSSSGGIALPGSGITTYSLGFDADWELDVFGGARRGIEAAKASTEAAVWNRRDAAVMLAAEVAQTYFTLRLDQAQAAIIASELQRQQHALSIAAEVARVGLTAQIDVTRQRASITATAARLEPVRADQQVRIHALGILLGIAPETLFTELATTPDQVPALGALPVVPAGLPSDLLRRRPDIRAAERQLASANAEVGVAVADLYPRFSLTGMEQLISTALSSLFEKDSLQVMASGAVDFPLFDSGRRRATVGLRKEDFRQAYVRYQATVLGALRDVEDPLAQIDGERRRNAALRQSVVDALSTAHAVEAQYRTGFVAQDSLLNAEANVLDTREQLAGSDAQLRQMTAALFKALGGGWELSEGADDRKPDIPGMEAGR